MLNSETLRNIVQDHDRPVLAHLVDIRITDQTSPQPSSQSKEQSVASGSAATNGLGYRLEFHFTENEYFTNKVLSKEYDVR